MTLTELLAQYDVDEREIVEVVSSRLRQRSIVDAADLTESESAFWANHAGTSLLEAASAATSGVGDEIAALAEQVATSLTIDQAAEMLGVDRTRVSHRLRRGELYAFRLGRQQRLPRWQFHAGPNGAQTLPGLATVIAALPHGLHPMSVEGFFGTPDPDLDGRTPAQWLVAGGDPVAVVQEAETLDRW